MICGSLRHVQGRLTHPVSTRFVQICAVLQRFVLFKQVGTEGLCKFLQVYTGLCSLVQVCAGLYRKSIQVGTGLCRFVPVCASLYRFVQVYADLGRVVAVWAGWCGVVPVCAS